MVDTSIPNHICFSEIFRYLLSLRLLPLSIPSPSCFESCQPYLYQTKHFYKSIAIYQEEFYMTNSKNTTLSTKISHVKGNKQKSAGKPGKSSQKSSKVTNTHHKTLAKLFPSIRSRKEALHIISSQNQLSLIFQQWSVSEQELFLDYCTGAKGVKVLYDGIFKEIFNPEATPGRLEELLSLLLNRNTTM